MHEIFTMLLAVFDRAALMLICLFFLIRLRLFRELLHKSAHTPKELLAVTAIFSLFALFSTWSGVPVEGSLVNVRIIAVMSGGILFGPWVGAIVGAIAGVHRYLIDIDGVTAVPCFITSIVAGLLSGFIGRKVPKAQRWKAGILAGMLCETLTMILVIVWAPSFALGIDIVSKIGIPMILGPSGKTGARHRQQNAPAISPRQQRVPASGMRHYPPRYQCRCRRDYQYPTRDGLRRRRGNQLPR